MVTESYFRLGTWCCGGVASQADTLDIILHNEGEPLDLMMLQSTQQPAPDIDGYLHVESAAPEYDQAAGVAIYWREEVWQHKKI